MYINNDAAAMNVAFGGINAFHKIGILRYAGKEKIAQELVKSFSESKVLQKYCAKNDVGIIFDVNRIPRCDRHIGYAGLKITKLFQQQKPSSVLGKFLNFFKRKPKEQIFIHAIASSTDKAAEKLNAMIKSITSTEILEKYTSSKYKYFGEIKRCSHCRSKYRYC